MKFIIDAQLPPALADWLRGRGHEAWACRDLGLRDADDRLIWARAERDGAIIVTKDEDFSLFATTDPNGPRVLWVRMGNLVTRLLLARFEGSWPEIETHLHASVRVVELR